MSVAAMAWAWQQRTTTATERLVLLALSDYANDEGTCWPGLEAIGRKAQVSRRTVCTAVASLEAAGLVSRDKRASGTGQRTSNLYCLAMPKAQLPHPTRGRVQALHSGRPQSAIHVTQSANLAPKPAVEPKPNPPQTPPAMAKRAWSHVLTMASTRGRLNPPPWDALTLAALRRIGGFSAVCSADSVRLRPLRAQFIESFRAEPP